jgi:hypothetical protein
VLCENENVNPSCVEKDDKALILAAVDPELVTGKHIVLDSNEMKMK